ncbi:MAG: hypothetical protein ACXVAX_03445 [Pseudobdellovibrio sp.]
MATKSSYLLAVLLIANPFMLLVFQNCSSSTHDRTIASNDSSVQQEKPAPPEFSVKINEKLEIK